MSLSVEKAARDLNVSPARVRALIRAGALPAEKVSGVYVLDERAVDHIADSERPAHVRPFSPRIAWAAAALVDGVRPMWIRNDELSRLRARLNQSGLGVGTWRSRLARVESERNTYRIGPAQALALLADQRTTRTGASATNLVAETLIGSLDADVIVANGIDLSTLRLELGMLPSSEGNVTVRVAGVPGLPALGSGDGNAYRLVVAGALIGARDTRARSAGIALLTDAMAERLWTAAK